MNNIWEINLLAWVLLIFLPWDFGEFRFLDMVVDALWLLVLDGLLGSKIRFKNGSSLVFFEVDGGMSSWHNRILALVGDHLGDWKDFVLSDLFFLIIHIIIFLVCNHRDISYLLDHLVLSTVLQHTHRIINRRLLSLPNLQIILMILLS